MVSKRPAPIAGVGMVGIRMAVCSLAYRLGQARH